MFLPDREQKCCVNKSAGKLGERDALREFRARRCRVHAPFSMDFNER